MSFTPYFNIAILSIPRPKASPEYLLESILQFSKTIGFMIPHPKISNQSPLESLMSSADGS